MEPEDCGSNMVTLPSFALTFDPFGFKNCKYVMGGPAGASSDVTGYIDCDGRVPGNKLFRVLCKKIPKYDIIWVSCYHYADDSFAWAGNVVSCDGFIDDGTTS